MCALKCDIIFSYSHFFTLILNLALAKHNQLICPYTNNTVYVCVKIQTRAIGMGTNRPPPTNCPNIAKQVLEFNKDRLKYYEIIAERFDSITPDALETEP